MCIIVLKKGGCQEEKGRFIALKNFIKNFTICDNGCHICCAIIENKDYEKTGPFALLFYYLFVFKILNVSIKFNIVSFSKSDKANHSFKIAFSSSVYV